NPTHPAQPPQRAKTARRGPRARGMNGHPFDSAVPASLRAGCFVTARSTAEDEVDGEVREGKCCAECCGCSLKALDGAFVHVDAAFEASKAAGLAVAEEFFHLGFEFG